MCGRKTVGIALAVLELERIERDDFTADFEASFRIEPSNDGGGRTSGKH
jgi:hypothetical protein